MLLLAEKNRITPSAVQATASSLTWLPVGRLLRVDLGILVGIPSYLKMMYPSYSLVHWQGAQKCTLLHHPLGVDASLLYSSTVWANPTVETG